MNLPVCALERLRRGLLARRGIIKRQGEARRVLWGERYRSVAELSLLATVQVVSPKCWPEAVSLSAPKRSLPSLAGTKPA